MRSTMRQSSLRGGGMGSWFTDIASSVGINLNPTYSPVWQTAVAPAIDVASTIITGVPAGSIINAAANILDPHAASPPPVAGAPQMIYPTPVTPAAQPATAAAAPASKTGTYILYGLGGLVVAGAGYGLYQASKKKK